MLACRLCRINIAAPTGCDACNQVRANLVATDEQEDDRPSLSSVGSEVVSDLKLLLKGNRAKLKANPDDDDAADRLLAISNTLSKVLESARKLQDDGVAAVKNMSFSERAALFVQWLTSLPASSRSAVREQWDKFEADLATPQKQLHE